MQEARTAVWIARRTCASNGGVAFTISKRERQPAPPAHNRVYLPASDDVIGPFRNVGGKHPLLAKGKIIDGVCRQVLRADVIVAASNGALAPGRVIAGVVVTGLPGIVHVKREALGVG